MEGSKNISQELLFHGYARIRKLGTGAFATVYLVKEVKSEKYFAAKCLSMTRSMQFQIQKEANLLRELNHPSIPKVKEIIEVKDKIYFIQEYAKGISLKEYLLHQNCYSQEYIMQIVLKICDVIKYLHLCKPCPVIFGDLKPEHILLNQDTIKLIDFGSAIYLGKTQTTDPVTATLDYAAPELLKCHKKNEASDIYAFGMILKEMLRHYAKKDMWYENMMRIANQASCENPNNRYPDMGSIIKELKELEQQVKMKECDSFQRSRHLKIIAVAGMKKGIGVTHLSISLCNYLNQREDKAIYVKGKDLEYKSYENYSYVVVDMGISWQSFIGVEADFSIFIVTKRMWEADGFLTAYEKVYFAKNLQIICNYGCKSESKEIASILQRKVFTFPLDKEPYKNSKEKARVFSLLLKGGSEEDI